MVSGWERTTIGKIGNIKTGPFGTLLKASEYADDRGVPLISVREVGRGKIRIDDRTPLVPSGVIKRLPEYLLKEGDIVFGRKGAVDRSAIVGADQDGFFLGSDGIRLRIDEGLHPPFYAIQFQTRGIQNWLLQNATGTTMASLNQEVLRRVPVVSPPVDEQKAIAAALADVDQLIDSLEVLIAKKRDIRRGAMRQLLTGRTRLPGFGRAVEDASSIPSEWEMRPLFEALKPASGQVDPRNAPYRDMPLIAPDHIEEGSGKLLEIRTAADQGARSGKYVFRSGTVVYSKIRPYLRKAALLDFDGLCSADMYPLVARQNVSATFMLSVLLDDCFTDFATAVSMRSGIPKINRVEMAAFSFACPPFKEQDAIAEVLGDLANEIFELEARVEKQHELRAGMMHQLMTGQVRLT